MERRLQGTHLLANNDRVEVRAVTVLAQPVGAFLDYVARCSEEDLARAQQGRVLVIDAGFYSLDWTLIEAGRVRDSSSGTSTLAMSALLERAEKHLRGMLGRHDDGPNLMVGPLDPVQQLAYERLREVMQAHMVELEPATFSAP